MGDELKADREVVMTAVQKCAKAFEFVGDSLKKDKEFSWSLVQCNPEALQYVGKDVTEDNTLMREYAKWDCKLRDPSYPSLVSSELRGDKAYVLDAVNYFSYSILVASDQLKEDRDVWLACLDDGDGGCLWCECPESVRKDWEFAVECCRLVPNFSPDQFEHFSEADLKAEISKRGDRNK